METNPTSRPQRITMRSIWQSVLDSLNLERGLIGTTISLTRRPGTAIHGYLLEDRERLMPPFRYLLFMVAIGTFITVQYFKMGDSWMLKFREGVEQGYNQNDPASPDKQAFMQAYMENTGYLFNNYFNLFILLGVPICALATRWLFRRRFNYAEHLVINSYVTGYLTVVYIVLSPILLFTDFITLSWIYFIITFIYSIIVYQRVFQSPGVRGTLAALSAMLVYLFIYYIFVIALFIGMAIIEMAKMKG